MTDDEKPTPAPSPSTREALPTTPGSVIEATRDKQTEPCCWMKTQGDAWVSDVATVSNNGATDLTLVRVLFDAGATREPVPTQLTDEEVWTVLNGCGIWYSTHPGNFKRVKAAVECILAARLTASTDRAMPEEPMTDLDLTALRAVAESATPGRWIPDAAGYVEAIETPKGDVVASNTNEANMMPETEAVTLTDEEYDAMPWPYGKDEKDWTPAIIEWAESILAARLAGAGAQVNEAAVEAAAVEIKRLIEGWMNYDDEDWPMLARAALSTALPHLGTGQSEAEEQRDLYKLELDAADAENADLRARISATSRRVAEPRDQVAVCDMGKSERRSCEPSQGLVGPPCRCRWERDMSEMTGTPEDAEAARSRGYDAGFADAAERAWEAHQASPPARPSVTVDEITELLAGHDDWLNNEDGSSAICDCGTTVSTSNSWADCEDAHRQHVASVIVAHITGGPAHNHTEEIV